MTSTPHETILGNAGIVLADRVIQRGWVAMSDGRIAEFGEGDAPAGSVDAAGDLIMPGLIELHTDHLEMHYVPRPKVFWDPIAAVVSYDGQLATSGITTVLDSLRVWREDGAEEVDGRAGILAEAITTARDANLLRAEHFLHLRCEIPMPSVVEEAKELIDRPDIRLMSLMDHTPGQRQFRDEKKLREYYRGKGAGMTDAELDALFEKRFAYQKAYAANNMREIVALAHQYEIPLASHDDTTDENVADAIQDRVSVAEFPTISKCTTCRAQKCSGIRSRPWSPMTASWPRPESPRCWIRCGSGARTAPKKSTAGPAFWRKRSPRRATQICCAPSTSCICAAKSRCPAWSRKPRN